MGSQWVEDPSWGNIFKGLATQFAQAPTEALQQADLIDKIKTERANRAAAIATGKAYDKTLPLYGPTTEFNPVAPSVDSSGNWSTAPLMDEPADIPQAWTDPAGAQKFSANRDLYSKLGMQAALAGKTSEIPGLVSYGQVATSGVPDDQGEQQRLQFATTGKFEKPTVENYVAKDAAGNTVRILGGSSDGGITDVTGKKLAELAPPGSVITKAGVAAADAPVLYGDKGRMQQEFSQLSERVNRNEPLSVPEIERANVLREALYPQSGSYQTMGGRQQYVTTRPLPVPDYGARLSGLIDGYRNGDHLQPDAASPAAPVPYANVTGSGATAAAGPSAAATPPPAAAPIVPPGIAANAPQLGAQGPANPAELRKEIASTQAFSDYATAIPSFNTMIKASQGDPRTGLPTNASDLNIIYAIAKLFDPGSVVREGELKLAAGAAPIAQVLQSNWSRLITGEGSLTPQTRAQLIGEGMKRMEQYQQAKNVTADWYGKVAKNQGLNPDEVIPPMPDMLPYDKKAIENPSMPGGAPPAVAAPTRTRPTAAPTGAVDHDAVRRLLGMQ